MVAAPTASSQPLTVSRASLDAGGARAELEAEQVAQLEQDEHERDAGGEAGRHRVRDERHQLAQPGHTEEDQDRARHEPGDQEPGQAELADDRHQDHHEGRGRAGDLDPGAAQERADDAGDDRRVEAVLGRDLGPDRGHRHRQRHRQRHGDRADGHTGEDVGLEVGLGVALAQAGAQPERELVLDADGEGELRADRLGELVDVPHRRLAVSYRAGRPMSRFRPGFGGPW
jgi:hypothetical protein